MKKWLTSVSVRIDIRTDEPPGEVGNLQEGGMM